MMNRNIFYWMPPNLEIIIATSEKINQYDQSFDVAVYDVLAKGEWPRRVNTSAMCKEIKDAIAPIVAKHQRKHPNETDTQPNHSAQVV